MKKIAILGSTGTIGVNTLEVIRRQRGKFKVVALACKENRKVLKEQIKEFSPSFVYTKKRDSSFEKNFKSVKFFYGDDLIKISEVDADIFVFAIPGIESLKTFVECVKRGKTIALATKEILVVGGFLVKNLIRKYKSKILPVDSEHNAIFQIIKGEKKKDIKKIYLTASGGPFYGKKTKNPKVKEVLSHPVWKMGKKITVDSATMMNKCFEIIEAHYLFSLPFEKIGVLIHPEAIVHGLVEFVDGTIKAVMYKPDMKIPISYVLNYPERKGTSFDFLDIENMRNLTFKVPSENEKFIKFAKKAIEIKGSYPVVLNAANELVVGLFLKNKIKFNEIIKIVGKIVKNHRIERNIDIQDIYRITEEVKRNYEGMATIKN